MKCNKRYQGIKCNGDAVDTGYKSLDDSLVETIVYKCSKCNAEFINHIYSDRGIPSMNDSGYIPD